MSKTSAGNFFEDFRVGQTIDHATPRTVTVGDVALYNALYVIFVPLYPLLKAIAPSMVTTTEQIGRAMIAVAESGAPKRILENADINRL